MKKAKKITKLSDKTEAMIQDRAYSFSRSIMGDNRTPEQFITDLRAVLLRYENDRAAGKIVFHDKIKFVRKKKIEII